MQYKKKKQTKTHTWFPSPLIQGINSLFSSYVCRETDWILMLLFATTAVLGCVSHYAVWICSNNEYMFLIYPPPFNSGKWRLSSGSATKHVMSSWWWLLLAAGASQIILFRTFKGTDHRLKKVTSRIASIVYHDDLRLVLISFTTLFSWTYISLRIQSWSYMHTLR